MSNDTSPEGEGWDDWDDNGLAVAHGILVALLIILILFCAWQLR